jgi:hypothetical protein
MVGEYVMTQANCVGEEVVEDGVGMAAYTMDSHNIQRVVTQKDGKKMVKNEGNVEIGGFGPYPISYRSIIPKKAEVQNLFVPAALSATHIAYGSIRMEPVFMVLGQSAAVAASMAIDNDQAVQDIDVAALQQELRENPLADGSTAEILVDNDDAGVEIQGNWERVTHGGYGPSSLHDLSKGQQSATVRYVPFVKDAGEYEILVYFSRTADATQQTQVLVSDGKMESTLTINESDFRVEGQTSGEWVSLGIFSLSPGTESHVKITNQGADGVVVADAVLWVPMQ